MITENGVPQYEPKSILVSTGNNLLNGTRNESPNGDRLPSSKSEPTEPLLEMTVTEKKTMSKPADAGQKEKEAGEKLTHPQVKHPTSFLETLIHLLKGNIGSGMFAMGDAFKNAGILAGPLLTLFLGVVCIYNNHVLVKCANLVRDKKKWDKNPNFPETVELCFETGPDSFRRWTGFVRKSVKVFVIITQLGFCCVYFVFVSSTMKMVLKYHGVDLNVRVYMLAMLVPVVASCLIRSLKFLAPVSLASNVCVCASVLYTLVMASKDLPAISSRPLLAPLSRLPLFLGTTIYSFEGISLILPLQNEMRNQRQFATPFGVLNIGLSIVTALLIAVGFIGYLKFGEGVSGSLSLNLEPSLLNDVMQIILSVGIVFSYALQFYVAADLIWIDVTEKWGPFKHAVSWELLLRTILVLFTLMLAAVIPKLGLFISLIGAVSSTALALIYPALCDIAVRCCSEGPLRTKDHSFRMAMDALTLAIAVFVFLTGTFFSVKDIIEAFYDGLKS